MKAQKTNSPQRNIPTDWIHGLDQEQKQEFEKTWRNSTFVLDKLKAIINRKLEGLELDKEDDYKNPNWPIARADKNGQIRQLKYILSLLP